MKIICTSNTSLLTRPSSALRFVLYERSSTQGVGSAGASLPAEIRKRGMEPSARAWDFLSIALAIASADESCSRATSPDGWTRQIDLHISVTEPEFWQSQASLLESALKFLTCDIWKLTFLTGGTPPPVVARRQQSANSVCLLSGGLDSLAGAIDQTVINARPMFVSQIAKGDKETQKHFAISIDKNASHLQLNHLIRPTGLSERSQRARSLIFLAYGAIAATSLDSNKDGAITELTIPENGFISLNIPLTPLRLGSLSTRTTHPVFLSRIQKLFTQAGLRIQLKNPYQYRTKGEILKNCKDQKLLAKTFSSSTSCGRYARTGFQHCGRCVPCLIRRAAIHHWRTQDKTTYRYRDLSVADRWHRNFDDVRSASMAVEQVRLSGLSRWAGIAVNSSELGDTTLYFAMLERGIKELDLFLRASGAL